MALVLTQSISAIGPNIPASFLGVGGVDPLTYAVLPGGAGGTIDSSTGLYTAPAVASSSPAMAYDTIQVTDSTLATATARILVGTPLLLFCNIIEVEMDLPNGRVYLWDQKINQPKDSDLYIAVSVPVCKPFGSGNLITGDVFGMTQVQSVNMMAQLDLNVISRGPAARDRKEEVILALNSVYSQQQQTTNSFFIGTLPPSSRFINLSQIDGAAIPYRYQISLQMQYSVRKTQSSEFYENFEPTEVTYDI